MVALAAAPAPTLARAPAKGGHGVAGTVLLGEQPTQVRWIDGDTFRIASGPHAGASARLTSVNALETYGPVHRIGTADPAVLWALARSTAALAASREWRCTAQGRRDGYGRLLVDCPDAALELVRQGHAMAFSLDGAAAPALLAAQREAQAARRGLWAGGAPPELPSSLHSAGERGLGAKGPYDRIVDTRTGQARARGHRRSYAACQEVCLGEGEARACMTYVPFERRYRDGPACLEPASPQRAR